MTCNEPCPSPLHWLWAPWSQRTKTYDDMHYEEVWGAYRLIRNLIIFRILTTLVLWCTPEESLRSEMNTSFVGSNKTRHYTCLGKYEDFLWNNREENLSNKQWHTDHIQKKKINNKKESNQPSSLNFHPIKVTTMLDWTINHNNETPKK